MLYLVTGGSGSGKSEYAEKKICELCDRVGGGQKIYLATMIPYGEETRHKIARHQQMRKEKDFVTRECFTNLPGFAEEEFGREQIQTSRNNFLLLECMSNLIANEMFDERGMPVESDIVAHVITGVRRLTEACRDVVVVTNEVCSESTEDTWEMRRYKQILGQVNCRLAKEAEGVTEVVYGTPIQYRKEESEKDWHRNDGKEIVRQEKAKKEWAWMHLIIGGAYQGKLEYAKQLYPKLQWINGETCEFKEIETCEGIYHFEGYIKRLMRTCENEFQIEKFMESVRKNQNVIVISDEIGYGLVPIDAFERQYRENVGRICTQLCSGAERVTRVVCGIGMEMK